MALRPPNAAHRRSSPSTTPRLAASSAHRWYPIVIVLGTLLVYANSLSSPLVFDDRVTILENSSIRAWSNPLAVLAPGRELPVAGRPLANLTFAANYALGGTAVEGYHVVNLALHIACALLLYGLVWRTLSMPRFRVWHGVARGMAAATAMLWAAHPINSEVVNYLSQRTESMMALALLTTLYANVRAQADAHRQVWQAVAFFACLAGMASKETMVVAPILVVCYDAVFARAAAPASREADDTTGADRGARLWNRWPFYGALFGTWLLLGALMSTRPRAYSAGLTAGVDVWTYLLNQAPVLAHYGRLMVWPTALVANYGVPVPLGLADVLPQALGILLALLVTIVALVRWPAAGFLGAWVFLTLAPTSSIVPIATEVGAERRMYLASMALVAGAVVLSSFVIRRWMWSPATAAATACGVAVLLGTATMMRNREYGSGLMLAETSAARWPSSTATLMLGTELAAAGRHAEALPHLRKAAEHMPRARYHLGVELFNAGDLEGARRELQSFVTQEPELLEVVPARALIGRTFAAHERWDEAIDEFTDVLRMAPANAQARDLLVTALGNQGAALVGNGRLAEAIAAFRRAVALAPENPSANRNLATALYDQRDVDGARPFAERAVQASPADAGAHNLLGRILAIRGDLVGAERHLARAVQLSPGDPQAREDLARVQAARR